MGSEQRRFPRFNVELSAKIKATNVSVKNVSMTGMQVACPGMFFDFLAPTLKAGDVELALAITDDQVARMKCKVVYLSDFGDETVIGLSFSEFLEDGETLYRGLIAEREQAAQG